MLTSAAQPLSHPAWLQALTLHAAERTGNSGSYCMTWRKGYIGLIWLVLSVRVGLAWGLLMGASHCLRAAGMRGVSLLMSFWELRYLIEN